MMVLMVLGGVAALALGIWLGLPGRYDRSQEEVDRALEKGKSRRSWTKRHFTPLDLLRKEKRGSERRRVHRPFKTAAPKRRENGNDDEPPGPPKVSLGR